MSNNNVSKGSGFSRRSFLKGMGLASAAAAGMAVTGCAPQESTPASGAGEAAEIDAVTQRLLDRNISGAALPEAAPILPVDAPDQWDDEADVVVVGLGGGGMVATCYLADQGLKVIGLEKQATVGGACRHAGTIANAFGGAQSQIEAGYPGNTQGDLNAAILNVERKTQFSTDESLIRTVYGMGGEAFDYIVGLENMPLACIGLGWQDPQVLSGEYHRALGMDRPMDALEANAIKKGADLRLNATVSAFVTEGERVIGIKYSDLDGSEKYVKADKGVILMAGGFGMNKDLLKAYIPSAYEGAVQGGPMPYHTGEVFRMGLGVGADFAGFDSWSCWEGAIDESIAGGDGEFWHYFWHGERAIFHNPWLVINKQGKRLPYYEFGAEELQGAFADLVTTSGWMSTLGHKAYSICDANFATDVFNKKTTPNAITDQCRIPITSDLKLVDNGGLVSNDWRAEFDEAVERGAVKKADTLDELAEMLGLEPSVLTDAVDRWNAICEAGEDTEMAAPYDPSWLSPVKEAPFYAAIIGGQVGKTLCGLRVNENLQVVNEDGAAIPGLYAGYSTAGGFVGENNYGAHAFNGGLHSGVGSSLSTGYIAAKKLIENE